MARKGVPVHGDLHVELKNGVKLCEYAHTTPAIAHSLTCVCACVAHPRISPAYQARQCSPASLGPQDPEGRRPLRADGAPRPNTAPRLS
jgi:hypothetical protein